MKTIGYRDLVENKLRAFIPKDKFPLFPLKKNDRIKQGLKELKTVGNIAVYLIKGNKIRLLNIHRI